MTEETENINSQDSISNTNHSTWEIQIEQDNNSTNSILFIDIKDLNFTVFISIPTTIITTLPTTEMDNDISIKSSYVQKIYEFDSYLNITKEELSEILPHLIEFIKIGKDYQFFGKDFELVIKSTNSTFLENSTHINFQKCEDIIRKEKNMDLSKIITLLQLEIYDNNSQSLINNVEYRAYDHNKTIIDLSPCKDVDIQVFYEIKNESYDLSEYNSFKESGIDIFNINDAFFNDICHPYSLSKKDLG